MSFNPLAIGSNVLINYLFRFCSRFIYVFQSPSNRVKCSDLCLCLVCGFVRFLVSIP